MKYLIYIALLLGALSCNNTAESERRTSESHTACFQEYEQNYQELLTKNDIEQVINIDEASYKFENSGYGAIQYQWGSDRPELEHSFSGQVIRGPDRNRVELKNLNFYDFPNNELAIEQFEMSYKLLSDQELNQMIRNLEVQYKNDPEGLASAKKLLEMRTVSGFEVLEGLGSSAYWKWDAQHGIQLNVLIDQFSFTIECKLSADMDDNLKLAEQLAKKVLEKCI